MSFILNPLTRWYAGKLGSRLGSLGLKYHDVVAETGVYMKAISRLPEDMQEARVVSVRLTGARSASVADATECRRLVVPRVCFCLGRTTLCSGPLEPARASNRGARRCRQA
jgi:hypothetical protein